MTLQEQMIAKRTAAGLRIVLQLVEGDIVTVYPKDQETKARWIAGYQRTGAIILEQ